MAKVIRIWEAALGPDHPEMAVALTNLAWAYSGESRYADAEALMRRVLSICERSLGPEHPQVFRTLSNLGRTTCRAATKMLNRFMFGR